MPQMPEWLQWILGAGAVIGALAVIWTKVLKPLSKLIVYIDKLLPLVAELLAKSEKDPDYLSVLGEIAAQFKTDSGSTLRDVINRLEQASIKVQADAEELRIKAGVIKEEVAVVKELAKTDRAEMSRDRVAADHKLAMLDDVLVRMKHLEGLLAVGQANTVIGQSAVAGQEQAAQPIAPQPISLQQLIPPQVGSLPTSLGNANVIAVVEAHKPIKEE